MDRAARSRHRGSSVDNLGYPALVVLPRDIQREAIGVANAPVCFEEHNDDVIDWIARERVAEDEQVGLMPFDVPARDPGPTSVTGPQVIRRARTDFFGA